MGQPLYSSAANADVWGERGYGDGSTPYDTQLYHLASMASWLSPTGISHHGLLPHIPSIHLSAVNSSPCPGIAPQSPNSSSQQLCLPEDQLLSGVHMAAARTVWFSFHLGCHSSAVSLSALNVSPLTQTIALCGDRIPASVPSPAEGRSSPTNTPVFPPGSFILQSFVWFYIFFSTGQVLLSALSWFSACTSVSKGIFLMYLWRQVLLNHLLLHYLALSMLQI